MNVLKNVAFMTLRSQSSPFSKDLINVTRELLSLTFLRSTKGVTKLSDYLYLYFPSVWNHFLIKENLQDTANDLFEVIYQIEKSTEYDQFISFLEESDLFILQQSHWDKLWIDTFASELYDAVDKINRREKNINASQDKFINKIFGNPAKNTEEECGSSSLKAFIQTLQSQIEILNSEAEKRGELNLLNQILNRFSFFQDYFALFSFDRSSCIYDRVE